MPLFASFIYKAVSRTAHTLRVEFCTLIHPLGCSVHFDQCKNTLALVAFYCELYQGNELLKAQ